MDIVRQILAVLLVFGLLGAALWALRRRGSLRGGLPFRPPGRGRALEVVERLALTPQHSLHIVRIRSRELVVATYPNGSVVLTGAPEGEGK